MTEIIHGMTGVCPNCMDVFSLCRACNREHWYCSSQCSEVARRLSLCRAARKYKTTEAGRKAQRVAQAKYRAKVRRLALTVSKATASAEVVVPPPAIIPVVSVPDGVAAASERRAEHGAGTVEGSGTADTEAELPPGAVGPDRLAPVPGGRQMAVHEAIRPVDGRALRVAGSFSVSHHSSAFSETCVPPAPQPVAKEEPSHDRVPRRGCRVCGRLITHIIEGRRFPRRRRLGRRLTHDPYRTQS